jgi:cation diffusion facilitator family transporter
MGKADTRKVVVAALAGNVAIACCKFVAALLSHSPATLAEAVHSVADSGNQVLLLVGMSLAAKPASEKYPFGRSGEMYFWPFVVALMLFSVGGAFGMYEGVVELLGGHETPPHPIDFSVAGFHVAFSSTVLNYLVLGASFLFEALSFRVAYREFKLLAGGKPLREAIFEARDPTIPLVLAEDTTALVGLGLALVAVVLRGLTGRAFWDAAGSVVIGLLLGAVALILASVTHRLIVGTSASPEDEAIALRIAEDTEGVQRVTQILTFHVGPEVIVLAVKVAFDPRLDVVAIEETTNIMERRIREELPRMRKIFIEVDSRGDGRGLARARAALAQLAARPTAPRADEAAS